MPRTSSNKPSAKTSTPPSVEPKDQMQKRGPGRPPKSPTFMMTVYSGTRPVELIFENEERRRVAIIQITKRCARHLEAKISCENGIFIFMSVDYIKI